MTEELLTAFIPPVTAVVFIVNTQTGSLVNVAEKLAVQDVTIPDPTVITPRESVPVFAGSVPHAVMVGFLPPNSRCPATNRATLFPGAVLVFILKVPIMVALPFVMEYPVASMFVEDTEARFD